jgi:hypothetical protein
MAAMQAGRAASCFDPDASLLSPEGHRASAPIPARGHPISPRVDVAMDGGEPEQEALRPGRRLNR